MGIAEAYETWKATAASESPERNITEYQNGSTASRNKIFSQAMMVEPSLTTVPANNPANTNPAAHTRLPTSASRTPTISKRKAPDRSHSHLGQIILSAP